MTVAELIEELKKAPPDLPVGSVGYETGEIKEVHIYKDRVALDACQD